MTATATKPAADGIDVGQIHSDLRTAIKRLVGRGTTETRKQSYLRFNDRNGRTIAYLHDAGKRSVRVEVRSAERGYDNVRVHDAAEAEKALELVTAAVSAEAAAK